jgi:hypothetical protein
MTNPFCSSTALEATMKPFYMSDDGAIKYAQKKWGALFMLPIVFKFPGAQLTCVALNAGGCSSTYPNWQTQATAGFHTGPAPKERGDYYRLAELRKAHEASSDTS